MGRMSVTRDDGPEVYVEGRVTESDCSTTALPTGGRCLKTSRERKRQSQKRARSGSEVEGGVWCSHRRTREQEVCVAEREEAVETPQARWDDRGANATLRSCSRRGCAPAQCLSTQITVVHSATRRDAAGLWGEVGEYSWHIFWAHVSLLHHLELCQGWA